jgi:hypothetical protein
MRTGRLYLLDGQTPNYRGSFPENQRVTIIDVLKAES